MSRSRLQAIEPLTEGCTHKRQVPKEARHVESPYLTTKGAMDYLIIGSTTALYRLIREHRMPFTRVGNLYRFDKRELDAWMRGATSALELARKRA